MADVTVKRGFDSGPVNAILNHPAVFPLISVPGIEKFDIAPQIADPSNYFLMVDGGCVIFTPDLPGSGLYEVHTSFLPLFRGRHAIQASLACYRWMFAHTDCMMLQTRVPAFNRAADLFCKMVGASLWFERKAAWPTKDGLVDLKFFTLSYMDWARRHAAPLIASGKAFHDHLIAERVRLGVADAHGHDDDECHDLHVGACVEMIYGGQPEKGIGVYNRWARFAGYGQIALRERSPLTIDIGDCVLLVEDHTFKVITCRQ